MNAAHLADMANRIGQFFSAFPDHDEAVEGVAEHIARFWEPRMRRQIFAMLDSGAADELLPLVAEALRDHREMLCPGGGNELPIPPQGESEA
ncbi:MAG: formate dehydrogenase subunit delta [Caldimonas sp.]